MECALLTPQPSGPQAELPEGLPHLSLYFKRPKGSFPGAESGDFQGLGLGRWLSLSVWLSELASHHEML